MAIYTEVSDEDLDAFVDAYDIGTVLSCKGIAEGVENTNYLMQTDQAQYILTLYENAWRPRTCRFLNLMKYLADAGILSDAVAGRDGNALRTLCGRPAAIVTFLHGMLKRINAVHCAEVGAALARFHNAGAAFGMERPNALASRLAAAVRILSIACG